MKSEKLHAKEAPKARIIILPVLMVVIILSAVFASDMPLWVCILLGIFNADLVYFLFVILKVHRIAYETEKFISYGSKSKTESGNEKVDAGFC